MSRKRLPSKGIEDDKRERGLSLCDGGAADFFEELDD